MARTVALWRCKCGTRVKVVAETDSTPSATQTISCPTCRDPHSINAAKIISVTKDMSVESAAAVSCTEKERLLVAQNKAFDVYRRGVSELAQAAANMGHADFEFLASRVRAARQFFIETQQQLDEHTVKHGC